MSWWAPVLFATAASLGGCDDAHPPAPSTDETAVAWQTYEEPSFRIQYPEEFRVEPSLPATDGEGHESVFFRSRDGGASFYILSPQWGREATDLPFNSDRERELMVEEKVQGDTHVVTRTIVAKNGPYGRLIEEYDEQDRIAYWVTAFEYRDEEARSRYREAYERFKGSLEQLAED